MTNRESKQSQKLAIPAEYVNGLPLNGQTKLAALQKAIGEKLKTKEDDGPVASDIFTL